MMHPIGSCSIKTIERLGKLIKLIFISDHPSEVSTAVEAVRRLLASENVDAHWLADRLTTPQPKGAMNATARGQPSGGAFTVSTSGIATQSSLMR